MSKTSLPHADYNKLLNDAFELAKCNLFPKQPNDETIKNKDNGQSYFCNENTVFDIHKDGHAIKVFEDLEKAVNARIVQQISNTNKPCILIIGNDYELTKAVVSLAYFIHTKTILKNKGTYNGFYYIPCLGRDTKAIEGNIEQDTLDKYRSFDDIPYEEYKNMRKKGVVPKESAFAKYKSGCTLFLRGVKSTEIFERLTVIVGDEKSDGLLIVNAKSRDVVPGEFLELCETILLEPEKQSQVAGTPAGEPVNEPQTTTPKQKRVAKLFYNYNEQDKVVLSINKHPLITLTEKETKLFLYLKEDRRTPDEIIGHIWEGYKQKDLHMKSKNVKELRGRLNKRCSEIGVETVISKLIDGYYHLNVDVVER